MTNVNPLYWSWIVESIMKDENLEDFEKKKCLIEYLRGIDI